MGSTGLTPLPPSGASAKHSLRTKRPLSLKSRRPKTALICGQALCHASHNGQGASPDREGLWAERRFCSPHLPASALYKPRRLTTTGDAIAEACFATPTFGAGNAGNFNLTVNELSIGANSSSGTNTFGTGDGGILSIESGSIEIIGTSTDSPIFNGINATS